MRRAFVASLAFAIAVPFVGTLAASAAVTINETGSTLLSPLFRVWAAQYARVDASVRITSAATGSGNGIEQASAGTAQIGGSDAYMTDAQMKAHPDIVDIPLAISAQTVNYNLPGMNGAALRLDGPTLAGIYSGSIRSWDDAAIIGLNPGVTLPHHDIIPIRRSDGAGDTFIFTQFLTFSTPSWESGPGYGTTVAWPNVAGAIAANGNAGVVEANRRTPYSVAYIGISFFGAIASAHLGTAKLKNEDGDFVVPTAATITAAANVLGPRTPADERLSLVFAPGADSYPLVNYEYAIVSTKQANPAAAAAMRKFLLWSIATCDGNAKNDLAAVHFIALPDYTRALSEVQIAKIRS
jgi:phosphate transport system substrate-binding protein